MTKKKIIAIALAYIVILTILCIIALPIVASMNLYNFCVLSICEIIFGYVTLRLFVELMNWWVDQEPDEEAEQEPEQE